MKIEIWSDYGCPYCYKGKRTMEIALKKFEHRDQIELLFRSYVLSPDAFNTQRESVNEMLVRKYHMTRDEIESENQELIKKAAKLGLEYRHLDTRFDVNTFDAHRLGKYAAKFDKEELWTERLMKASFTDGLFIGNHETLLMLGKEIGLDEIGMKEVLNTDRFINDVKLDIDLADQLGIETVPFFAIDRTYAISGVITVADFLDALDTAWNQKK